MTEPLKPRMDFSGTLEQEQQEAFKAAQTFNTTQAEQFSPVVSDMLPAEEGQVEAVVEAALRPKRSLWRRMVSAGLVVAGVTVVGQGVQWAMNAWQTQDWVALGGCAAGALIVGIRPRQNSFPRSFPICSPPKRGKLKPWSRRRCVLNAACGAKW